MALAIRPTDRPDVQVLIRAGGDWSVRPCRKLIDDLVELLGEDRLLLRPKVRRATGNGRRGRGRPTTRSGYSSEAGNGGAVSEAVSRFN